MSPHYVICVFSLYIHGYLTIRPVALSGYGAILIAHEAKPNGLLICGP